MSDPSGFPCQTGAWLRAISIRTSNLVKDEKPEELSRMQPKGSASNPTCAAFAEVFDAQDRWPYNVKDSAKLFEKRG